MDQPAYESALSARRVDVIAAGTQPRPATTTAVDLMQSLGESVDALAGMAERLCERLGPVLGDRYQPVEAERLRSSGDEDPRSALVRDLDILRSRIDGITGTLHSVDYRLDL